MSFISCMGPASAVSRMSRMLAIHWSVESPFTPLYLQWAARPFSATRSMRRVRNCTSTHFESGPITVAWRLSYPLLLGMVIQSRIRAGLAVYMSARME